VIGNQELKAIDAGRRPPGGRGVAKAGWILGIIGTVLPALVLIAFLSLMFAYSEAGG